jgi:adenine/guanine phosphoribosyltransferase-like PRPP-binding protein
VRSQPKEHLLSYGGDDVTNHPQISGDRLPTGTTIHVIDDFVHSAATLRSAVATLREVGLVVNTASSLLASPPESLADAIHALQIRLTALAVTSELFG